MLVLEVYGGNQMAFRASGIAVMYAIVALVTGASCAQFTADKVAHPEGTTDIGKLHVQGNRQRIDVSRGPHAGQVIIVRPDIQTVWYLMPSSRR